MVDMKIYNTHSTALELAEAYAGQPDKLQKVLGAVAGTMTDKDIFYLPGGADIDPALYGEANTHSAVYNPLVDAIELALVKSALVANSRILAICRGHQLLTVATGGTLHQDLSSANYKNHRHSEVFLPSSGYGTPLGRVFQNWKLEANSMHHQATRTLGPGWSAAAWASDGVIESIYHPDKPWVISCQWHPELIDWQLRGILAYLKEC